MASKDNLFKLPQWCDTLLQGLSFWIGYKRQYFYSYHLSEGAIMFEALNLIQSHIEKPQKLSCEVTYKKLGMDIDNNSRADIAISTNETLDYIIEIKKAESTKSCIEEDIIRLAEFKRQKPSVVCFLLIVSQGKIPKYFVSDKGIAVDKKIKINNINVKTRRVCKAVNSFNNDKAIKSAHYACLIEVEP